MDVQVMVSTGGTSLKDDIMRLYNTVHIMVATPGRVLDLANKGVADLSKCNIMVMDEVRCTTTRSRILAFSIVNHHHHHHRHQPRCLSLSLSLSCARRPTSCSHPNSNP